MGTPERSTTPQRSPKQNGTQLARTSLTSVKSAQETGFDSAKQSVRLRTMWPRLQRLCRPASGRLWFVGGRPGNYKTQAMWNLATDMALCRQRVLFVSLEQTPGEMGMQSTARFSGIPLETLLAAQRGEAELSTEQKVGLVSAGQKLTEIEFTMRLHGAADHGTSLRDVLASATAHRFDAVFIDHLGMIGREESGSEFEHLAEAVNGLRKLCRGQVLAGYAPFVCCTSPLNRRCEEEGNEDRAPQLADFRGSGLIESDADLAMILKKQKRDPSDESDRPDIVNAFVPKNRQGRHPLLLQFEAHGATCTVIERPQKQEAPPQSWTERED